MHLRCPVEDDLPLKRQNAFVFENVFENVFVFDKMFLRCPVEDDLPLKRQNARQIMGSENHTVFIKVRKRSQFFTLKN